jgi:hypothetical protein
MRPGVRAPAAAIVGLLFSGIAAAQAPSRTKVEITLSGPTVVTGDWRVGANVITGTDSSNDTVNDKDRARVREYNTTEAQRQGQLPKSDPVSQAVREPRPTRPLGPGFSVAQQVNGEVDADTARAKGQAAGQPVKERGTRVRATRRGKGRLRGAPADLALGGGRPVGAGAAAPAGRATGDDKAGTTDATGAGVRAVQQVPPPRPSQP